MTVKGKRASIKKIIIQKLLKPNNNDIPKYFNIIHTETNDKQIDKQAQGDFFFKANQQAYIYV